MKTKNLTKSYASTKNYIIHDSYKLYIHINVRLVKRHYFSYRFLFLSGNCLRFVGSVICHPWPDEAFAAKAHGICLLASDLRPLRLSFSALRRPFNIKTPGRLTSTIRVLTPAPLRYSTGVFSCFRLPRGMRSTGAVRISRCLLTARLILRL